MSMNASRHGAGLGYINKANGFSYEVAKALLAEREHISLMAEVDAAVGFAWENHYEYQAEQRKGKGVAWVMESVKGMGRHLVCEGREYRSTAPVLTVRKNNTRQPLGRVVVVQVNSKLCMLHLL